MMAVAEHVLREPGDCVLELTRLGLTTYEAKAYLALVRRDSSTASEVARVASLPRQRIYDVVESLLEKGLAAAHPGRVATYDAVPPNRALERLLAQQRQQLEAHARQAAALTEQLRSLYDAGREQ